MVEVEQRFRQREVVQLLVEVHKQAQLHVLRTAQNHPSAVVQMQRIFQAALGNIVIY